MRSVKLTACGVLFAISILGSGCMLRSFLGSNSNAKEGTKIIKSVNGKTQITIPASWNEEAKLNDEADIQVSDRKRGLFVIVLSEERADFEKMDLKTHSATTRNALLSTQTSVETLEPVEVTIGGNAAIQYEIHSTTNNQRVGYLHTTIETGKSFHQIIAWTLMSRFEENRPLLQEVSQSLKEIAPPAP